MLAIGWEPHPSPGPDCDVPTGATRGGCLVDVGNVDVYISADGRVVAFTASVTVNDRSRIGEAGFDGFLSKPINLKEFVDTVRRMLGEAAP